ncbi:hypothetical protein LLEC1_04831 [Akanthomyces lecanii]|uniref:Uncharacterized protein n=1 Tax=Cordyceps confragosa TaxID=2714763 RepID=A0A179ID99_CORDF|nr:hypothetical protein LLEC1_04831 [Akanthomyces lecanii]
MAESAYIACAENISLLHLLSKIPEPPSDNTSPALAGQCARYTVPFATERSLASTLAFLSSITDNPNCITAVCIQEQTGDETLEIYIAINKKSPKDNNVILNTICDGINQVFGRLSSPGHGNCESDVFAMIVSLCRTRILCRLGYERKTAFKSTRNPLDVVLGRARQSLIQLRDGIQVPKMASYRKRSGTMDAQITEFLEKAASLLQVVSSWMQYQADGQLCAVIQGLCDFAAINEWREVLDLIPDRLMDPTLRQSLASMLRKGARYRHAARILYRAAKKFPIARHMAAVAVKLAESSFQRPSLSAAPPSLEATLQRTLPSPKRGVSRICAAVKASGAQSPHDIFAAQVQRTLTEGKIHAEVQLLSHILTHPSSSSPPPRIVCASKDACFLCNCLLKEAHAAAKLYTPRCHGKLYPGWRLPATAEFRTLQAALNRVLEQNIQKSAARILKSDGRRRVVYPDPPCESTCSTAMLSATTVAVAVAADGKADAAGNDGMLVQRDSDTTVVGNLMISSERSSPYEKQVSIARGSKPPVEGAILIPPETFSQLSNMVSIAHNPSALPATKNIPTPPDTPSSSNSMASTKETNEAEYAAASKSAPPHADDWTLQQSYALAQGEVVASSLPINKTSRLYATDALRVQLEYTATERRRVMSSEETPRLKYRIQKLTSREAHTVRESGYIPIIDASSMHVAEERTYRLDESTDLYLSAGDCIFRLVLQPAAQP